MATKHIYLSVGKLQPDGTRKNPRTGELTNAMRYRGVAAGEHDDPESFKRKMAGDGHVVHIHDSIVGELNQYTGHIEYELEG